MNPPKGAVAAGHPLVDELITPDGVVNRSAVRRRVLWLAWPAALQMLLSSLMMIVDTVMIARVGLDAMAAVSMAAPIMYTVMSILRALGTGTIATVSRATGRGSGVVEAASTSLGIAILLGTLVSAAGMFGLSESVRIFVTADEPGVVAQAAAYLYYCGMGMGFVLLDSSASNILRAAGDTRTSLVFAALANLLNVLGNYALIFGNWGFPRMGVSGAALATFVALGFQGLGTALWLFTPWSRLRLRARDLLAVRFDSVARLIRITLPATVEPIIHRTGMLVYYNAVVGLGTEAMAAHRSALTIESLLFMPAYGIGLACSAFVGQSLGARASEVGERGIRESARLSVYTLTVMAVGLILFAPQIMGLFLGDAEPVIQQAALCLTISAFEQPFFALAMVYGMALRGAGDTRSPVWVSAAGMWLVRVPAAYLFAHGFKWGITGIWMTMTLDWVVQSTIFGLLIRRGRWKSVKL